MAYTYRASSSAGNASGGALTITKPTGTANGDLIIVVAYLESGSNSWASVGAGFTRVTETPEAGTEFTIQMWYKWASSEPSSWTWTPTTTGVWRAAVCAAYSGGSGSGDPLDVHASAAGLAKLTAAQTAPSVTTTAANDLLIFGYGNFSGTDESGFTGAATTQRVTLGGCTIVDSTIATASATGTTHPSSAGTEDYAAIHAAFLITGAGGGTSINLAAATITAGPQTLTVTPGAASIALAAATLTAGPQTLTIGQTVNLASAALTAAAQTLTVTPGAVSIALASAALTAGPQTLTVSNSSAQHNVQVGTQYYDGTMKQIVRTSAGTVYVIAPNCDSYPDFTATGLTQTIRVYKGNSTGIPSAFSRMDSANEPAAVVGCAAAIDSSNVIHIAWEARSTISLTHYLRYATFNTATDTWGAVTTILSNVDYDDIGQGDENISIAIDASDFAHIVFLTTVGTGTLTDRRIYYTNNTAGSWAAAVQVDSDVTYSGNFKAWHPGIAFDETGRLLTWFLHGTFAGTGDGTVYIRTRETNGTWNSSVSIETTVESGIDQCIGILTTTGVYHFGGSGAKDGSGWQPILYKYSTDNGATWTANNPGITQTHNVTIGPGNLGGIRLYHHGAGTPVNVYYTESAGSGATWSAATEFAAGEYDSSFNTRWSQYNWNSPLYADVVYWNQNYPNVGYYGADLLTTDITIALAAATLTAGPQVITLTPGAVSIALAAAAITAGPQIITISAPGAGSVTINLAAATISAGAQTLTLSPGAVSIALAAAGITAGPQTLAVLPGAVSIGLAAAALAAGAQTITLSPGPASIALAAAALTAAAQTLGVSSVVVSYYVAFTLSARGKTVTLETRSPAATLGTRTKSITLESK